jgi:NAD(P)-dependent dehydrogenase (short-subunit alcohol dehydrogenase family)
MSEKMKVDLSGKTVIITGAGGSIGGGMAEEFAYNGANVVVAGRTARTLEETVARIKSSGGECTALQTDVSDKTQVAALIEKTIAKYGGLDVLVNNAGVNGGSEERKNFWEYSDDLWEKIISIDLSGVYYCSKPAAKYMIEHDGGSIINVASVTGLVPLRLQCAYTAAKAGVINLSKAMALELAPKGVRVNVVCPGSIMSEQVKDLFYNDKERTEAILSHIPQHRPGAPRDIAAITCFLASDEAAYITGSVNAVDGGWICGYNRDF